MFYISENGQLELYFLPLESKVSQLLESYQNHTSSESYFFTAAEHEQAESYE